MDERTVADTLLQKKPEKTEAEYFEEWKTKYGEDAAKVIQDTVKQNVADYEYMKKFAIKA